MYGFTQQVSRNNGGINQFFFTDADTILKDPRPRHGLQATSLVVEEIPLIPNAFWYQAKVTKFTLRYRLRVRNTRHGVIYRHALEGALGKMRPESLEFFNQFRHRKWVVVYLDRNGLLVMVGSKKYPLEFEFSAETGRQVADLNGSDFEFAGESKYPSWFYHGNLYDYLATDTTPDFGDVGVQPRVLEDGVTIRIIE